MNPAQMNHSQSIQIKEPITDALSLTVRPLLGTASKALEHEAKSRPFLHGTLCRCALAPRAPVLGDKR
jgi:hypothetical protein